MSGGYNPEQGFGGPANPGQGAFGGQPGAGHGQPGYPGPGSSGYGPPAGGPGFGGPHGQPSGQPGFGGQPGPGSAPGGAPGSGFGPGGQGGGFGGPGNPAGGFGGGNQGFPPQGGFGGPPTQEPKKKPWLIPLIIGLAVVVLGGGFLLFWLLNRDDEPQATPAPTTPAASQTADPVPSDPPTTDAPPPVDPDPSEPVTSAPADPDPDPDPDPNPGDPSNSTAWPDSFGDWSLAPGGAMESTAVYNNTSGDMVVFMLLEGLTAEQLMMGQETTNVDGALCAEEPSSQTNLCAVDHGEGSMVASSQTLDIPSMGAALNELMAAL